MDSAMKREKLEEKNIQDARKGKPFKVKGDHLKMEVNAELKRRIAPNPTVKKWFVNHHFGFLKENYVYIVDIEDKEVL